MAAAIGHAVPWQMGLQPGVTPVAEYIHWFHNFLLLPIITVITLFVLGLLIYVMVKFNAKANPVPSKTTHNTLIEVLWTVMPILILVVIAIPSFRLLYLQRDIPKADMTIKVIGNPSWNWTYEYPDLGTNEDGTGEGLLHRLSEGQGQARAERHLAACRPTFRSSCRSTRSSA